MRNTSLKQSFMQTHPTAPDKFSITSTINLGKMLKLSILPTVQSRPNKFIFSLFSLNLKF